MGWLRDPDGIRVLEKALFDPDLDINLAAAHSLSEYDMKDAYLILFDTLSDGRLPYSRLAAFLEESRFSQPLPILLDRAEDFRPKVRFWIAYLLGTIHDTKASTVLIKLAEDENADV